jgi:transposase
MRQIREILRLKFEQRLSHRAIAGACRISVGAVSESLGRARRAGVEWPLPRDLEDAALEAQLYPDAGPASRKRPAPDCVHIYEELRKTGVTLQLLWEEYREIHPDGYGYSQFCALYRRWARKLKPTMRQVHHAGEKIFVDFSGKRPHWVNPKTGETVVRGTRAHA